MAAAETEWPAVSVVIPTHGRPELVRRTIAGVVAQDYDGVIETIVVHDKEEPDPSLESSDAARPVRVKANDHASGLPGARNAGIDLASADIIASLDDDDEWLPGKVRAQVEALVADPDLLVVATDLYLHTAGGVEHIRRAPKRRISYDDLLVSRVMELHSSNLMMRRRAFELAGLYDEDLVGVEDYDWLLRVTRHNSVYVVPDLLVRVYRDTPLWRPQRWQRIARAREQIIARHPDLLRSPRSASLYLGKIAFAYAAGGDRRAALRWALRSTRRRPFDKWALVAFAVAVLHLPVSWVQRGANRVGRSI